jgi:hypothetical protein
MGDGSETAGLGRVGDGVIRQAVQFHAGRG